MQEEGPVLKKQAPAISLFFSPAFCVAKNLNPSYFCNSLQNQAEN